MFYCMMLLVTLLTFLHSSVKRIGYSSHILFKYSNRAVTERFLTIATYRFKGLDILNSSTIPLKTISIKKIQHLDIQVEVF